MSICDHKLPQLTVTITGSQELGREFRSIVLKFLLVILAPRALAWDNLFYIMVT